MSKRISQKMNPAIWALTPQAVHVAGRLMGKMDCGQLFTGPSIANPPSGTVKFKSLSKSVECEFYNFSSHIFIMAAGIVIRVIAPLVKNKLIDPAVIIVDDHGRFAVSLLSGHLGGANELAEKVAEHLNAVPVITTATDINHVPSIDLLAKEHGLLIENPEAIKRVNMAFLKGLKVGFHDPMKILIKELHGWTDTDKANDVDPQAGVYVDYRINQLSDHILVLRPKLLAVGIGCNRNTDIAEIVESVRDVFFKFKLSINSIESIATIDAKDDEPGILKLARLLGVPVKFFSRDDLERAGKVPTPSEVVKKHMGVASICEAAAILSSNQGKLLVPKQVMKNVTIAVGIGYSMFLE